MNSLEELNNYAAQDFEFNDERDTGLIFDRLEPTTPDTVETLEGVSHSVPVGIEILQVINYTAATPTYTIDVSAVTGATVTWPTVPAGCTVTNPSAGVYTIDAVNSPNIWNQIKSPSVNLPNDYTGTFLYTVTIDYNNTSGAQSESWTVTTVVSSQNELTTPLQMFWVNSTSQIVSGYPQIQDTGIYTPTYTITMTPSNLDVIDSLSSSGSGGSSSYNPTTKVLTITGSKIHVNSHLSNITFVSTAEEQDFTFEYYLTNDTTAETDTKTHDMRCTAIRYLGNPDGAYYYTEDTSDILQNSPVIRDINADGTGTYILTITPSDPDAIASLGSVYASGLYGTWSFDNVTKVITFTGTRTQINTHLIGPVSADTAITIYPGPDYNDDFTLTYQVQVPTGAIASKVQDIYLYASTTEVENMSITRTYIANNKNEIFSSNTPYISDTAYGAVNYTIVLSSALGQFGTDGVTAYSTYSYTGSKSSCNGLFASMKFYPNPGVSSNGTFNYKQYRDGDLLVDVNVSLLGTPGAFAGGTTLTFTSTQTWTPQVEYVKYATADYLIVGAGGGGGEQRYPGYGGGGGGGGGCREEFNKTLTYTTYTVTVGAGTGGTGGSSSFDGYVSAGGQEGSNGNTGLWVGGDSGSPTVYGGSDTGLDPGGSGDGAGGGGGAGQAGQPGDITTGQGGDGGDGFLSTITGLYYGAGGGGGASQYDQYGGAGGNGGGGAGGNWDGTTVPVQNPQNGTDGRGGGGGGESAKISAASRGQGGDGVVVIRIE